MTFDYARYLAAKTTVDDRALNQHVLAELRRLMPGVRRGAEGQRRPGTMVARPMDWARSAPASTSCWMRIGSCWIILAGGCAIGRPRAACAATCCRMGCRWVICGCAWRTPSSAITRGRSRGAGRCADRQRRAGPGGRARRPAWIVAVAGPRRGVLVHHRLRRRASSSRPPSRRPGHAGLSTPDMDGAFATAAGRKPSGRRLFLHDAGCGSGPRWRRDGRTGFVAPARINYPGDEAYFLRRHP